MESRPRNQLYISEYSLTDPIYNNGAVCIVSGTNSITASSYEISRKIEEQYSYSDSVSSRIIDTKTRIATKETRGEAGTATLARGNANSPVRATIVTQYGIGQPIDNNEIAQRCARYSHDKDHSNSLKNDTFENRIRLFDDCLLHLHAEITTPAFENVKLIGRSGYMDLMWLDYYFPIISNLANFLHTLGKTTCLSLPLAYREKVQSSDIGVNQIAYLDRFMRLSEESIFTLLNTMYNAEDIVEPNRS